MYIGVHVKYPSVSDFNETWIFTSDFRKVFEYQFSWISVQWEPSYFVRTDGLTDGYDEGTITVTFRDFENARKNKKKFRELSSTDIVWS